MALDYMELTLILLKVDMITTANSYNYETGKTTLDTDFIPNFIKLSIQVASHRYQPCIFASKPLQIQIKEYTIYLLAYINNLMLLYTKICFGRDLNG